MSIGRRVRVVGVMAVGTALALGLAGCDADPVGVVYPDVQRVEVGPADRVLTVGDTMRLTAYPMADDGTVLGSVLIGWRSEDEAVAAVHANGIVGVVAAKAPGTARIEATAEGRTGGVSVTVVARPLQVATVEIVPADVTLQVGQSLPVEAVARAADGTVIGGRAVVWTSSHGPTVTADSHGNSTLAALNAHAPGEAVVRAEVEGVRGEARVRVAEPTLSYLFRMKP